MYGLQAKNIYYVFLYRKKKKASSDLKNIQQTLSLGLVRVATCGETDLKLTILTTAAAKLLQSSRTLCDPRDGGPPGSPTVPGLLQARTLEWVAISFSTLISKQ